ncbi:MAG TPA: hypothetical protein PKE66_17820 [Pyrinomonadaceae bacterium]|nr:hypothetical protein [Pyrinomonadaceae bacterium]
MNTRLHKIMPDLLGAIFSVSIIQFLLVYGRFNAVVDYSIIFRDWFVGVSVFLGLILVSAHSKMADRPAVSATFIGFFGSFLWVTYKGIQNYLTGDHMDSSNLSIFLERHLLIFLWVASILVPVFGFLVFCLIRLFRYGMNKVVGIGETERLR